MSLNGFMKFIFEQWMYVYVVALLVLSFYEKKPTRTVLKIVFSSCLFTVIGAALGSVLILPLFWAGAIIAMIVTIIGFGIYLRKKFAVRILTIPLLALLPLLNWKLFIALTGL